jgi:hypothetical protein
MIGQRKRKKLAGELAQDLLVIVFLLVQLTARLAGQKAVPLFFAGDFLNAKSH